MTQLSAEPLLPNNSLITSTPEEGRVLAIAITRASIQAMQKELEALKSSRAHYSEEPLELLAASHVVAVEFATIAAANNYWR
jgi:hypothetical protein